MVMKRPWIPAVSDEWYGQRRSAAYTGHKSAMIAAVPNGPR
jgi:hypothetical protein